jgi:hypothetical protein
MMLKQAARSMPSGPLLCPEAPNRGLERRPRFCSHNVAYPVRPKNEAVGAIAARTGLFLLRGTPVQPRAFPLRSQSRRTPKGPSSPVTAARESRGGASELRQKATNVVSSVATA